MKGYKSATAEGQSIQWVVGWLYPLNSKYPKWNISILFLQRKSGKRLKMKKPVADFI
jgi:hypothetical protein